ncbi:hypothetical protein FBR02_06020 [Anaerolineae bacterium CFX9]|nr:hypothetical protein [Anaerolineae bacterium CFX9]
MGDQKGYWVGDKFYPTSSSTTTAIELKQKAGVDTRRQLIALMPDGTWQLVQDNETVSPSVRYDDAPSFTYG